MGLVQTDTNTRQRRKGARTYQANSQPPLSETLVPADTEAQAEQRWESAIANSMDVIREMANKALGDREAGRTKKVTL